MKVALVDVLRAHFNALSKDLTYVQLPDELHHPGRCGRPIYNLYGTRIAASAWERDYGDKMAQWGFIRGASNPCVFRHASRPLWVVVHGDDFIRFGDDDDTSWFKANIDTVYQCKLVKKSGPEPQDQKSMSILNRVVE